MRIAIVGPGTIQIPPKGWGAVEIIVHEYAEGLRALGWNVLIINTNDKEELVRTVDAFSPDFVHCQYDEHIDALKKIKCQNKAITSHFGYLDQVWAYPGYYNHIHKPIVAAEDILIFALSRSIARVYVSSGVDPSRIRVIPNGVNVGRFSPRAEPKFPDRSICLAKVDFRKRQGLVQSYNANVYFAGGLGPADGMAPKFNPSDKNYLGEWTKDAVYTQLTEYANLVLLSDGEAHPLVCMEALAAGLGLVLSEYSTSNLDLSKSYIDVIPENRITDLTYVKDVIERNRETSIAHRTAIIEYAKSFSWSDIIKAYAATVEEIVMERTTSRSLSKQQVAPKISVAIVTIATGKYFDLFFRSWLASLDKFVNPHFNVTIYCFTDAQIKDERVNLKFVHSKKLGWPFDSLMRFHKMEQIKEQLQDFDRVLFMDCDMEVVSEFESSIFENDFFAVRHPGFADNVHGSPFEVDLECSAYVGPRYRKAYVQGCFFGGTGAAFNYMVQMLANRISRDLAHGQIPVWHDESYLNWFLSRHNFSPLSPGYAYPEGDSLDCEKKIIHKNKPHDKVRSTSTAQWGVEDIIFSRTDDGQRAAYLESFYLESHKKVQRLEARLLEAELKLSSAPRMAKHLARRLVTETRRKVRMLVTLLTHYGRSALLRR